MYYQFLNTSKKYIINLQEHSIRITEQKFLRANKELLFVVFDNNFFFDEAIEKLNQLKEETKDKELIKSCEFIIQLLEENNYYLYLYDKEITIHHIGFLLSDLCYQSSHINGHYSARYPDHELYESVVGWRKEKTLHVLNQIDYNELFDSTEDGVTNEFIYLSLIAGCGFEEVADFVFGDERFEENFDKACSEIGYNLYVINNVLTDLAKHPQIFNKYIHKFGDLSRFNFYGNENDNIRLNIVDALLVDSGKKFHEIDSSVLKDITPSNDQVCETFIYRNMRFQCYDRDQRLKNLEWFFKYVNENNVDISLNILHDSKYLIEYAIEDEDKEVTAILLKNGAKLNIKKSNSENDEDTVLSEVQQKNRYYNWLIRQSKK